MNNATKLALGSLAIAALTACGGGSDGAATGQSLMSAPLAADAAVADTSPIAAMRAQAANIPQAATITADQLFAWAQVQFSGIFAGASIAGTLDVYNYRFYPATGTYVAVANGNVFVLGAISGGAILRVGALQDFSCAVQPAACSTPTTYTGFSLPDPVFTVRSIAIDDAATSGTLTTASGNLSYSLGANGTVNLAAPFAAAGNLSALGVMVCRPANSAPGSLTGSTNAKSVDFVLPKGAVPASLDELKGRTFDMVEDCSVQSSEAFSVSAAGTFAGGSHNWTAANVSAYLAPAGFATADATYYGRAYKAGSTFFVVERGIPSASVNRSNTNGYLAVLRSR